MKKIEVKYQPAWMVVRVRKTDSTPLYVRQAAYQRMARLGMLGEAAQAQDALMRWGVIRNDDGFDAWVERMESEERFYE
jgi:hypothetical protein